MVVPRRTLLSRVLVGVIILQCFGSFFIFVTLKNKSLSCGNLDHEQCKSRDDCVPVIGEKCQTNHYQSSFFGCYENGATKRANTYRAEISLPSWSSPHPDFTYTCASSALEPDQTFRFDSIFLGEDWKQISCSNCSIPPNNGNEMQTGLSLLILVHREFDSFANAVASWQRMGLLDYVDEAIVWINSKHPVNDPIEELAREYKLTVYGTEENIKIGPAITKLVELARNPLVLFLEKDFELTQPKETMERELNFAKNLLLSDRNGSRADVVHHRSRWNPGKPISEKHLCVPPTEDLTELNLYPKTFRGKLWDPRLFCNIYRFFTDEELLTKYPNRVWKCGNETLCFDSGQCAWTNNPSMFRKRWYLDTLKEISLQENNPTFEAGTYYSPEWVLPHWVIAEPPGLFTHKEIRENVFGH